VAHTERALGAFQKFRDGVRLRHPRQGEDAEFGRRIDPGFARAASTSARGARKLTCSVLSPSSNPARRASSRTVWEPRVIADRVAFLRFLFVAMARGSVVWLLVCFASLAMTMGVTQHADKLRSRWTRTIIRRHLVFFQNPRPSMPLPPRVEIHSQCRIFDDFFKIDEVIVSHQRVTGEISAPQRRLIFERGDAAAALLLDLDAGVVVLTRQFRAPSLIGRRRDDASSTQGWMTETVAGMVEPNETPEETVIRETMEETGYRIRDPRLIAKFFSSAGGSSERIFLYFSKVRAADKLEKGGGDDGEDIEIVRMTLGELFDRLDAGSIDEPKLLVSAYWLQAHLKDLQARKLLIEGIAAEPPSQSLKRSTVRYAINGRDDLIVGYKTGAIDDIEDVSIWVNSENTDMMMDRFLGKSISARIRYLGANKDEDGRVIEDTVAEELRSAVGRWAHVKIGTVLTTSAGMLRKNGVRRIFHIATVEGGPGSGVLAELNRLQECVEKVLAKADRENNRFWKVLLRFFPRINMNSILIPMLGAGDGGLAVEDVAKVVIPVAIDYFRKPETASLKEIYFLAFKSRDKNACDRVLDHLCSEGALVRLGDR
jgi:nudix-type nucleoside diphosphatase (YffH/AdpP family)